MANAPHALNVHPSVPARTVPEFVAWLKADDGKVNCASQGNGTLSHLESELLAQRVGARTLHVAPKPRRSSRITSLARISRSDHRLPRRVKAEHFVDAQAALAVHAQVERVGKFGFADVARCEPLMLPQRQEGDELTQVEVEMAFSRESIEPVGTWP